MKHHFCLYYMFTQTVPNKNYSGWYPPATIETGTYFYLILRLLPTCYHRNKNINSTLYSGCYSPVAIETRLKQERS